MRIQHNIAALNSHRQLSNNNSSVSKNLEKLSSGYRINRAGDDAAGLAISEKMRAQITGLETAQKNANDGISLVQTAEGALTEVHSMLNRMVELADQSANGTYDDETDRANIQKEMESLKSEINRISEGTNYNGINLLDGSLGGGASASAKSVKFDNATVTESASSAGSYTTKAVSSVFANTAVDGDKFEFEISYKDNADAATRTQKISLTLKTKAADGSKILVGSSGKEYAINDFTADGVVAADITKALTTELNKTGLSEKFNIDSTTTANAYAFTAKEHGSNGAVITSISERTIANDTANTTVDKAQTVTVVAAKDSYKQIDVTSIKPYTGSNASDAVFSVNGQKFVLAATGTNLSGLDKNVTVLTGADFDNDDIAKVIASKTGLNVTNDGGTLTFKPNGGTTGSGGLTLQIGDTADDFNQLTVSVNNMSATSLGVGSVDVSSQSNAKSAVDVIKKAINSVSSTRGDLGAIQNRLEHTINNLGVTTENMTAAESRIRDVDMAKEMMTYTKNNILVQASQAMLAQANQLPQGVLQLLQ